MPDSGNPTSYLKVEPDSRKIKIGCFGASNTEGVEVRPGDDYPTALQHLLGDKYQVFNFGMGGYNSNQIAILAKHFGKAFDLDYIVIGPRGFYLNRATTLNHYWQVGRVPYAAFVLRKGELKKVRVTGKTPHRRILNYYSAIPSWVQLRYDHAAPSLLRIFDLMTVREIRNPLFRGRRDSSAHDVQVELLVDLSREVAAKVYHYTDSQFDCERFNKIN